MKISSTPPDELVAKLDPRVGELIAELDELRSRDADLQRRAVELRPSGTTGSLWQTAKIADVALATQAAREGRPVTDIGTPSVDALTAEVANIATTRTALGNAVAAVSGDLADAIRDTDGPTTAAGIVDQAAGDYVDAVDALDTARNAFLDAVALASWVDRAAESAPHSNDVGFAARPPGGRIGSGFDSFEWPRISASLRAEAESAGRPQRRRRTTAGTL